MARRKQSEINAQNLSLLKTHAADIIRAATQFKSTHQSIITSLNSRVYQLPAFQRMPSYYKGIIHGYVDAMLDRIWHNDITFQHYIIDTQEYVDAFKFQGPYTDPSTGKLRLDESKNRYVWNGTEQVYYEHQDTRMEVK